MEEKHLRMLNYSLFSTLVCLLIIFIYLIMHHKGKKIQIEDIIISSLIVIISSLRYEVGSDYVRYFESAKVWASRFSDIKSLFSLDVMISYSFEIGYKFLSVISSKISSSPYMIFWIVSLLIYIPIVVFCRKHTADSRIALAIFLLFGYWGLSLNILQQFMAMVLLLFANEAAQNKKYLRFAVLVICAELFHTTAIVASLLILLYHSGLLKKILKPSSRNLLIMVLAGIVLRFSTEIILRLVSNVSVFVKYVNYLNAGTMDNIERRYIMYGALLETIIVVFILYFAIRHLDELRKKDSRIDSIISLIMIGIPFSIIGISRTLWLSNRFAEFFFQFLIVLVPAMLAKEEKADLNHKVVSISHKQIVFWLIIILWHAVFAVVMLNNNKFVINSYLFI